MQFSGAPAEVRWDHQASDFIDHLVDSDVHYITLQEAIETLIHSGLKGQIAVPLDLIEGELVFWHPVPQLFPGMREINVFWVEDADHGLSVIHAAFAF